MIKEKKILSYFIGWLLLGIIVCFIGLSNVSASEIIVPGTAQFYDNSGTSLNGIDTRLENTTYFATFTTAANSYGGLVTFQLNSTLQEGRIYSIFLLIGAENNGGTTKPSTKPSIGIGRNYATANTSYINNTNPSSYSASSGTTGEKTRGVYYTFIANETGSYISVPYTSEYTCSNCSQYFSGYSLEDLGNAENLSQDEVNSIINNQTSIIQNDINNMEQSIVDSNKETQEVIKDQFNSCRDSVNIFDYVSSLKKTTNGLTNTLNDDGSITTTGLPTGGYTQITNPLTITDLLKNGETYTLSQKYANSRLYVQVVASPISGGSLLYYTAQSGVINFIADTDNYVYRILIQTNNMSIWGTESLTITNYYQLEKGSTVSSFDKYGEEICSNKIDETNDKLGDLNNSLNDSNVDGSLGSAGSFFDNFNTTDHGGLSGIITAPLVAINQMLNTSCSPMTATFKGKELSLPCGYEFWNRLGAIQDFVNIVLGGMLCYRIIIKLYKLIERIKNPEDDRLEVMDL